MNNVNNSIKVSIITPSFNQGQFIEETILSVLNQSYSNIEYIIVDGGSTDNTMDIVSKYRNDINIVIHEKDKGQADAINKGFRLATGDLVGWINSDDILYANCVDRIVALFNSKPDGSIFYNCNVRLIDGKGNSIEEYSHKISDRDFLLRTKYDVLQQGSFYKRDLVEKVGYLNVQNHYCMDLDLWLKLSKLSPIYYLDEPPLAAFRMWEENKTSTGKKKFLKNIREVLIENGAKKWNASVRRTYWYGLKCDIKGLLQSKGSQ